MLSLLQLVGVFTVVFGFSLATAYAVHAARRNRIAPVDLEENAMVRFVGAGGVYRCHFVRSDRKGLVFSSPIQQDHYVPLRAGEMIMVQSPKDDGLMTFRTTILSRDAETHEFLLAHPQQVKHVDRRSEPRVKSFEGEKVRINGDEATMIDISAGGAKVVTEREIDPGDQVRLELPQNLGSAYGWALESTAANRGRRSARAVRVKFQVPLSGLRAQRTKRYDLK